MTYEFSHRSLVKLASCDMRLRALFERVIQYWDCTILCGHRDEDAQTDAFRNGRSNAIWPESKHNRTPALAVDTASYPLRFDDLLNAARFAGRVEGLAKSMGIPIRSGGDFALGRGDWHHFELRDEG